MAKYAEHGAKESKLNSRCSKCIQSENYPCSLAFCNSRKSLCEENWEAGLSKRQSKEIFESGGSDKFLVALR